MDCDIVVDGGGSGTRLGLAMAGAVIVRREGFTCNPRSLGAPDGAEALAEMLEALWQSRPPGILRVRTTCLALSNVSTTEDLSLVRAGLRRAASWCAPLGAERCWVMNDIVPLVTTGRCDAAVICGTGTGFAALGPEGAWSRASGLDYLLADEGGGFDLGLRGLRAVVRALDGRGPWTALVTHGRAWGGDSALHLCRKVYGSPASKVTVATFAPLTLTAARDGDPVAQGLVREAAVELALGLRAVADRCGLAAPVRFGFAGSLLLEPRSPLLESFLEELAREPGRWRGAPLPRDTLALVAELAARLGQGAAVLDRVPLASRLDDAAAEEGR